MSLRPDNQQLKPVCEQLLADIKTFTNAVDARLESGDWTAEHLTEIDQLSGDLRALRIRISKIKNETW